MTKCVATNVDILWTSRGVNFERVHRLIDASMFAQVYQELLDLVKEEEIKEEKRRSQLFLAETKGSSVNSLDSSDGSSVADSYAENRDHLQDLYAVPKRNRSDGPRLPPRRVKSSYNRDPNWVSGFAVDFRPKL